MKTLVSVLTLCVVVAGVASAADPMLSTGYGKPEGSNVIAGTRDVCFSQPMDCYGYKISSEIIGAYGLESRGANDFLFEGEGQTTITKAIGYGGYYNWVQGDPPVTAYNLYFYTDAGCFPDQVICQYLGVTGTETFICWDGFGYPTYKYEFNVQCDVYCNELYWFVHQAADHVFPPQWGRQGTNGVVQYCESMFWSPFFGYNVWTPLSALIGFPDDYGQEFECTGCGASATQESSWGAIKGLYR